MKRKKWKLLLAGAIAFIVGFLTTLRSAPAHAGERDALDGKASVEMPVAYPQLAAR